MTAAVLVVSSAASGWLVFEHSRERVTQSVENQARRAAELFARDAASFVARREIPKLRLPFSLEDGELNYAALLDPNGSVLRKWPSDKELSPFPPGRELDRWVRVDDELWLITDSPVMVARTANSNQLEVAGWVRLASNLNRVESGERELLRILANIFLICTVLGSLLSYLLARAFLRHVDRLTESAESISRGEFNVMVKVRSQDEIGMLASAFNRMAKKLKASEEEVSKHTKLLENRVAARTEALQIALDELKVLDRLKDDFLSLVSHELRTPLTSIHSFTEILSAVGPEDEATRQEFLGIIQLETERLTRLVNNVLELVKAEAGEMVIEAQILAPGEVIETATSSLYPLLKTSDLSLDIQVEPYLEDFCADRDMIIQVFTNLISNAVKFSPQSACVTIVACRRHDRLHFEVQDQGPGVPPDELGKIFERFRQVGGVLRDKPKGTGLGLPICRKIVEAHNGKIWAENCHQGGLRVVFEFPRQLKPLVAQKAPAQPS